VEEDMARLEMRNMLGPSFIHHMLEPRHLDPKVLELERTRSSRPHYTGQEQRAMVRKRGREGVEDMVVEGDIPLGIAKNVVKFAHGWVFPFVAPSKAPVLEVYLIELTLL
jgi:hypothetical protein